MLKISEPAIIQVETPDEVIHDIDTVEAYSHFNEIRERLSGDNGDAVAYSAIAVEMRDWLVMKLGAETLALNQVEEFVQEIDVRGRAVLDVLKKKRELTASSLASTPEPLGITDDGTSE